MSHDNSDPQSSLPIDLHRVPEVRAGFFKHSKESAFDLDDTPLIPTEEVKACSILNPNCDSCQ